MEMTKFPALALVFLALLVTPPTTVRCSHSEYETFTVYFQEIIGGSNSSFVAVAGIPGRPTGVSEFGTVLLYDVPVTEGISSDSPLLGRAQGIDAVASMDGKQVYASFSIDFLYGKYSGSTMEVQGIIRAVKSSYEGELSVNSGTKAFRHVSGYAVLKTVLQNPATNYIVLQGKFTIKYDR